MTDDNAAAAVIATKHPERPLALRPKRGVSQSSTISTGLRSAPGCRERLGCFDLMTKSHVDEGAGMLQNLGQHDPTAATNPRLRTTYEH
jgi:hypothetical protein